MIQGIVATLVATLALSAWIAIGTLFVRRTTDDVVVGLPVSLLAGSGLSAAVYALLTRIGVVDGAVLTISAISIAILVLRRSITWRLVRDLGFEYRATLRENRLVRIAVIPLASILWICAIAPPRDADVMRYHLAHVRQIITDGRWETIRDFHYALPFGWTLGYLPFERMHLPQAASLVNVGLWLIMLGGLFRVTRGAKSIPPAAWICVLFLAHPFVLRVFSSAMADGYAVFVVYSIAALLATPESEDASHSALLGFSCWIGAQSRYQLLAAALAGALVFIGFAMRRQSRHGMAGFTKGALAAVVLSSPFYIVNLQDFGSPLWPLFVPEINGIEGYANHVAAVYSASLVGEYEPRIFLMRFIDLVTTPLVLPLALVLVLLVPASLVSRTIAYRRMAIFGTLILVIWALAQPRLFPKHVILLLPLGPMLAVAALDRRTAGAAATRVIRGGFATAIVTMIAASVIFSWDYVRYAVTGDRAQFHRFTWYYPVYDWVNRNTPRDSRFLVVAYSGHSYYLDRRYRRADPWLSGVVDWSHVTSGRDLDAVLQDGGYDYMIYDDRDWSDFVGGVQMASAVRSAVEAGTLVPVREFPEKLYGSRFLRAFSETRVYLLRRSQLLPLTKAKAILAPKAGTT
ncbi:MAG: hypothetical protein ABIU86_15125 [Gemmatimonadaceae bacterium]